MRKLISHFVVLAKKMFKSGYVDSLHPFRVAGIPFALLLFVIAKVIYSRFLFPHLLSEKIAIADIKKPWGWQVGITARIRKMGFCNFRQII